MTRLFFIGWTCLALASGVETELNNMKNKYMADFGDRIRIEEDKVTLNKVADHNGIKNVFVMSQDENQTEANILYQISAWEKTLLVNGYNVITRDKIKLVIEEQKISLANINNNIQQAGKLVGADAIFIVEQDDRPNLGACYIDIKLVSVVTGEVLMYASWHVFSFLKDNGYKSDAKGAIRAIDDMTTRWVETVMDRYKKEVATISK